MCRPSPRSVCVSPVSVRVRVSCGRPGRAGAELTVPLVAGRGAAAPAAAGGDAAARGGGPSPAGRGARPAAGGGASEARRRGQGPGPVRAARVPAWPGRRAGGLELVWGSSRARWNRPGSPGFRCGTKGLSPVWPTPVLRLPPAPLALRLSLSNSELCGPLTRSLSAAGLALAPASLDAVQLFPWRGRSLSHCSACV